MTLLLPDGTARDCPSPWREIPIAASPPCSTPLPVSVRRPAIGRALRSRAKEGRLELDGREIRVIDLPGIYSLDAGSLDEQVTRDYLLSRDADLIVNVVDASNLERNLYLTVQLLEMGVPLMLALNMMDVARNRGISLTPSA